MSRCGSTARTERSECALAFENELPQRDESSSFEFGFEQSFLVLRRPFPFVGNDARDARRNSGLPRNAPRFCSLVQNFLPLPLHYTAIPPPIPECKNLKTEHGLQIDAPVRRRLGKRLASEPIRKTEKSRTQIADRRRQAHVVEDIPR